jgi:hypothetical protein
MRKKIFLNYFEMKGVFVNIFPLRKKKTVL